VLLKTEPEPSAFRMSIPEPLPRI